MLTALGFLTRLAFSCAGARALVFSDQEVLPEEEEWRYEPSIDELYSDGGGDA
jgi:hypothetical protein